ncbi:MAG: pyruvate dehydrogenase (acetyl-transferring) E1 component subunit alpha, partial [Rickettsiales bacterium]|nr:pyruvate dehydrogenase (acetyl-transferring) E1 component subunit alpha [Rickettsiales bacterium]
MSNSPKDRRASIKNDQVEQLKRMVEIREFEEICFNLFAEGLIRGTTHLCNGQEAIAVGIACSLEVKDYVMCTYRGHGHALALGMTPETVLSEIMGKSGGSMNGLGGSMHLSDLSIGLLPTSAIVGAGIPIATGVAKSAQYKKTGAVAVSIFGDGATNIGAFHEGLNIAKVLNLPVIFICENNLYGEYSPLANTTSVEDLATRAKSYDMRNYIVDG